MRNTRRLALIGLSLVATGALLAGTASAEGASQVQYHGSAKADALTISIAGQTLTTSAATAELNRALDAALAKASSSTVFTPAFNPGTVSAETSTVGGPAVTAKPQKCQGAELTQIPGINRADVTGLDAGPAHWSWDPLLTNRDDPPWRLVIERNGRRPILLKSRRGIVQAIVAAIDPEHQR